MAVSDLDLYDYLEVLYRLGAVPGQRAAMIHSAKSTLEHQWSDDQFWDVAQKAEKGGLTESGRGLYALLTLAGARFVEAGRPSQNFPSDAGVVLLTDTAALEKAMSGLDDAQFAAVEQAVTGERRHRGGSA